MHKLKKPQQKVFTKPWRNIDFSKHPRKYTLGKGEQGVLTAEPYKSILLPFWRFSTPEKARRSARILYAFYLAFKIAKDYVGMDMTRKFIMMGWTRSQRYANRKTGKKYLGPVPKHLRGISGSHGRSTLPLDPDPIKQKSADIFYGYYTWIMADPAYKQAREIIKSWKKSPSPLKETS